MVDHGVSVRLYEIAMAASGPPKADNDREMGSQWDRG